MSVDREEVKRIAELATLDLSSEEVERLTSELNGILEHMEVLRGLSRAAEEPGVTEPSLRSARASEDGAPDALGAGPATFAPRWRSGFFVVPPPPGVHQDGADE